KLVPKLSEQILRHINVPLVVVEGNGGRNPLVHSSGKCGSLHTAGNGSNDDNSIGIDVVPLMKQVNTPDDVPRLPDEAAFTEQAQFLFEVKPRAVGLPVPGSRFHPFSEAETLDN